MPKFEITLRHRREMTMCVEVTAKDEETAQEKVEQILEKLDYNEGKIAKSFKANWEEDEDTIDVEDVSEL